MISPTAEYALRAIVALAQRHDRAVVTPDLAKATRISAPYLSKILQSLGRAELVLSQRGVGGGFRLARAPGKMSVLEVINAVDPVRRIRTCPLGIASHGTRLCPLHRRLDDVAERTEQAFAETTIAELLSEDGPSKALCASKELVRLTSRRETSRPGAGSRGTL
ncbi:MAG: Rrf2 family transcriptional regulator [Phycisphaerales bacterium]|nr:Rrf2 family transcriptional regulator [Phycisphaerales bacterium]